ESVRSGASGAKSRRRSRSFIGEDLLVGSGGWGASERLADFRPGAVQAGSHGAYGDVEGSGDLVVAELFPGDQDQDVSVGAADPAGQIAVDVRCVAVEEQREPVGFGAGRLDHGRVVQGQPVHAASCRVIGTPYERLYLLSAGTARGVHGPVIRVWAAGPARTRSPPRRRGR